MKKINLKDYYPYYIQDTVVEVPDEVADLLREYKLAEQGTLNHPTPAWIEPYCLITHSTLYFDTKPSNIETPPLLTVPVRP